MKKIIIVLSLLAVFTIAASAQSQLRGDWRVVSITSKINGKVELPYLVVSFRENRVSFNQICSSTSGNYTAGKRSIHITRLLSTLIECQEENELDSFITSLKNITNYSIKGKELILWNRNKTSTIKLIKEN